MSKPSNIPPMVARVSAAMEAKRRELIARPLADVWPELARVAIEAMREPSWEMCAVGGLTHSTMVFTGHAELDEPDCRYIFEAMMDAALSETGEGER